MNLFGPYSVPPNRLRNKSRRLCEVFRIFVRDSFNIARIGNNLSPIMGNTPLEMCFFCRFLTKHRQLPGSDWGI
jgi:hypothetical protein